MADNHPIFVISDLHMGDGGPRDNFPLNNRRRNSMCSSIMSPVNKGNSSSWATCSSSGR